MSDQPEKGVILRALRRHTIGAFSGTQVACAHCRLWMKTDDYHQHLAEVITRALEIDLAQKVDVQAETESIKQAVAKALEEAAHEIEQSFAPDHPSAAYRDGHTHAAWVVRSLIPAPGTPDVSSPPGNKRGGDPS